MTSGTLNIEELNWYALYVNSRAEKRVAETLSNKSIETYLPIVKTLRQWSDRKKTVELPLFTGYVFVKINSQKKQEVLQTKGVVNFVKDIDKIAIIRDLEIERLKQIISTGYYLESDQKKLNYKIGDKVRVHSGLLSGIEGYISEKNNERFVEIILEGIGQCVRVKLKEELLEFTND